MSSDYLKISDLTKQFGRVRALDGIDLTVSRGHALALLGPNGAGKSTLFGCLLGLTLPSAGEILLNGGSITETDRARIGYVAERVALYMNRTVAENATFFARMKGISSEGARAELARLGLVAHERKKTGELSKGMLQRLGLAIALCGKPELLVLDEPFNGLDPAVLDVLQNVLRQERERGVTLLISTHTMSAVEPIATDVAILLHGKLAAAGSLQQLRLEHGLSDSLEAIYHRIARRYQIEEVAA